MLLASGMLQLIDDGVLKQLVRLLGGALQVALARNSRWKGGRGKGDGGAVGSDGTVDLVPVDRPFVSPGGASAAERRTDDASTPSLLARSGR